MKKKKIRKKAVFFAVTLLIFTIFILITALMASIRKTSHEKKIGEEQIELLKTYSEGETILFYIDQSAGYAAYKSVYNFSEKGAYFNEPICKREEEYAMWENIAEYEPNKYNMVECYPSERDVAANFALFLNANLDPYFDMYPNSTIPKENYDFDFKEEGNITEIIGIPTNSIIINKSGKDYNTFYSVSPSFKAKISYNFISAFSEYSNKAREIRNSIQNCLLKGSGKPDDEDLLTCSSITKLEGDIENIGNYQITPVAFPNQYTLLFDIEGSFENPYSTEKPIIRFGIRFLDTFPPVATEIKGIEERGLLNSKKYLVWNKNNASDVASYEVYYKKIEKGIEGAKTKKPESISEMEKLGVAEKTEQEIESLKSGDYYFYVIAIDKANNAALGEGISPIELTI